MKTSRIHYLRAFVIAISGLLHLSTQAQFNNGITLTPGQEKNELSGRTWHISSKINNDQPLLGAGGTDLAIVGNNVTLTSHFIIEPAADDGKWWTGDARWFYIRSVNSGRYITINNTDPNVPVTMAPQYEGDEAHKQQFRAVLSATPDWYKLRSRLSDSGNGIVLEVGNNNDIYPAAPKADPSAEQKFAFNLAMPEEPVSLYSIVGLNNLDFISDGGIRGDGTVAIHVKSADRSSIWRILADGEGYFQLFNVLTQQYLSAASNSGLGDEVIMTTSPAGDRSKWELIRERHTFKFKNKETDRFIGTYAQTETGRPLREVGSLGIGIRWSVYRIMEPEAQAVPGDFERIAEAPDRSDCLNQFGDGFKRALAERVGFPADPAYFPFILAAVADSIPPGKAEETLAKFEFDNPGHRVNLALLVRQYLLKNVAVRPRATWSSDEELAVVWFEQEIRQLRMEYAQRVNQDWEDYKSGTQGSETWGFNVLLENVDADGFEWPAPYVINAFQDSLGAEYISAAATFNVQNPLDEQLLPLKVVAGVGVALGINAAIFHIATFIKNSIVSSNTAAFVAAEEGTKVAINTSYKTAATVAKVASSAAVPITVITTALSVLIEQAQDVAKVQELLGDIDDLLIKASLPVQIDAIMTGNNFLNKYSLFDDLDYLMGTPAPNGFQYNTNDNWYGPAVILNCLSSATVEIGPSGTGTLLPAQVAGLVTVYCGGDPVYDFNHGVFTCADLGANAVTMNVSNSKFYGACVATVTVVDNTPPNLICKNYTANLNAAGTATVSELDVIQNANDNCGVLYIQGLSQSTFNCADLGANVVTLTVDDTHGNSKTCNTTVTVADNTAPTVVCKNTMIYLNEEGTATVPAAQVFQSGTDNCGTVSPVSVSPATFGCNDLGVRVVTLSASDGHNNTKTCLAAVTVADNSAPTVVCPAQQSVSPTGSNPVVAVVNAIDGTRSDNCNMPALAYALSGATTGSGSGPASGLNFNGGVTTVTYTATDASGLTATCTFRVKVGNGRIIWENDMSTGVANVALTLSGDHSGSTASLPDGAYFFATTSGSNYTIAPSKNTNKLNGISAADVTAIQQHVTNINPLSGPYKRIAADVNRNNSITSQDASILNLALLGNPSALNQIKSWRFVPVLHTFPSPNVPWGFPEAITVTGVNGDLKGQDFIGIKTGDVASSYANPANFGAGEPLVWHIRDEALQADSEVVAEFRADQHSGLSAFQFALFFDPAVLELESVEPAEGSLLSTANFGLYNLGAGEIRVVWAQEAEQVIGEAAPMFNLRFRVLSGGGMLSEALHPDEESLPARCYDAALAESGMAWYFDLSTDVAGPGETPAAQLLQNRPNPFKGATMIGFVLPESCEAHLRVFDASGRVLEERQGPYPIGRSEERFDLENTTGILWYELTTPFGILTKKMVAVK